MIQYIIRRLLFFIPVFFAVAFFTFALVRAIPGGPFDFAGEKQLPPEVVANIEAKYHLDWPLWKQFTSYMIGDEFLVAEGELGTSRGVLRGDLGLSLQYRSQSVNDIIKVTLPISAQLGMISLFIALLIGLPTGIISAVRQNSWVDYISTFGSVFFLSIPNLVLAPILIWLVALKLDWFEVAGWGSKPPYVMGFLPQPEEFFSRDYWNHAILPSFALGTAAAGGIARLTRASLLQVIREDYMRTARAKGLRGWAVIVIHGLKNSLIPVITILGPMFAGLVTGSFIVEQIFGINGMGKHFISSIGNRDYTVLLGVTLLYSIILMASNLFVDIAYAWVDPRIRYD